jgi:hypothetical protein
MSARTIAPQSGVVRDSRVRYLLSDGIAWRVYESRLGQYDRRGSPHLFFECDGAIRRVRDYPTNWFELDDEALMRAGSSR